MTSAELTSYLIEDRLHNITNDLENWFAISDHFKNFCCIYRDKIRRKIRKAKTNEDLEDVIFELEIEYLLFLNDGMEVEYEKFGNGKSRAPDFFVTYKKSIAFTVEVTRIRETEEGTRFDICLQKIENEVRKIPSDLCVRICANTFDFHTNLVDRLETSKEKIIDFIKKVIETKKNTLVYDSIDGCPLEGFEDEFEISLTRPSSKDDKNHTSFYTPSRPIFYTQKEYYKFVDIVCKKQGQMQSNMANLLIIGTINTTHEKDNLPRAIDSINDNDELFFFSKGFSWKKRLYRENEKYECHFI